MREVAAAMWAGGITQDEFDRALQPRLAQARTSLHDNDYWFYRVLIGMEQFPQLLEHARSLIVDHESQTLASVQALASRYLDPARALPVLIVPAGAASVPAAGILPATGAAAPSSP
jgi:zinc protease